jgi:hypothetical protein
MFISVIQAQTKRAFGSIFGPAEAGNARPRSPTPRRDLGLGERPGRGEGDGQAPQENNPKEPWFIPGF